MDKKKFQFQTEGRVVLKGQALLTRLYEMHADFAAARERKRIASLARAEMAAAWIVTNRPELTFGVAPKLSVIADWSEQTSLAEFEQSYRGNAIQLHGLDFCELWWLDRDGRAVEEHTFAVRSEHTRFAIEYEIHFRQT